MSSLLIRWLSLEHVLPASLPLLCVDHAMLVLQCETVESLTESGFSAKATDLELPGEKFTYEAFGGAPDVQAGLFWQLRWLFHRELVGTMRDKASLIARYGITIFINLLVGVIFLDGARRDNSDPQNFMTHAGCLTFSMISAMFGSVSGILILFPLERPMLLRERFSGTYSTSTYLITKTLLELPLLYFQGVCAFCTSYWLIGFHGNFFYMTSTITS